MKCTYSLIALIKLDLPLPESPVIAMFTSTSRHFSSLFLKNSSMFDTPLSSISFPSSTISSISHSLKSAILKMINGALKKCCGAEVMQFTSLRFIASLLRSRFLGGMSRNGHVYNVLKLAKYRRKCGYRSGHRLCTCCEKSVWITLLQTPPLPWECRHSNDSIGLPPFWLSPGGWVHFAKLENKLTSNKFLSTKLKNKENM